MANWLDEFTIQLVSDSTRAEVGLWCDKCLLPSVVKMPLMGMFGGGMVDFGFMEGCVDCESAEGEINGELDCG